jgi:hypothetical protein
MAALFAASFGLIGQNSQSNGNLPQTVMLSGKLPGDVAIQPYNSVLTVNGGNTPNQVTVKSGSLPLGVTLMQRPGPLGSVAYKVGLVSAGRADLTFYAGSQERVGCCGRGGAG